MGHDFLGPLRRRLREIADLEGAAAVLVWDQNVHLAAGGADSRGQQRYPADLGVRPSSPTDGWLQDVP